MPRRPVVEEGTAAADVVVLGSGPAGATAAALLAEWGHDVVLLTRPATPAAELAQSIPPSARKLLERVGALGAMEGAGFHPNGGNTVWWAEGPARTETFAADAMGWHVDRAGLEGVLRARAAAAGVHVHGVQAHGVEEADAGWRIRTVGDEPAGPVELGAPWLLDATGRTGVAARRALRSPDPDTPTLALVRRWHRADAWADLPATHTLIESYQDGWAWSVPVTTRERCVTAMVDPELTDLGGGTDVGDHGHATPIRTFVSGAGRRSLEARYAAELAKCAHLGGSLESAKPVGDVWACPASLYSATAFAQPGLLLVGDAGSFIDPLSSYGVKKALASAWLAAVATHTALTDPPMADEAVAFYDASEREVYRTYRSLSVDFFAQAAGAYGHRFWVRRADAARAAGGEPTDREDPADRPSGSARPGELPAETAVRAAWEEIRTAETLSASPGSTLRRVPRPAVDGNRIVRLDHLASDAAPAGIRWVRGVDLLPLVDEAPRHAHVPDVYEAYCRRAVPAPLPDFLAALATAVAAGFLERPRGRS